MAYKCYILMFSLSVIYSVTMAGFYLTTFFIWTKYFVKFGQALFKIDFIMKITYRQTGRKQQEIDHRLYDDLCSFLKY